MISDLYRQSPAFRAEAIRKAEKARLVQLALSLRAIVRSATRASK